MHCGNSFNSLKHSLSVLKEPHRETINMHWEESWVRAPEMRSNRLNIDTGAFATGRLTCAIIEGSTIMALSTETEGDTSSAPVQSHMAPHVVDGPAIAP